jgi:hypothetical protein
MPKKITSIYFQIMCKNKGCNLFFKVKFIIYLNINKMFQIDYENISKLFLNIYHYFIAYQKYPFLIYVTCFIKYTNLDFPKVQMP